VKSVDALYGEALAMARCGLRPAEIARRLVELSHESGLSAVYVVGRGHRVDLRFSTGETIRFDGAAWRLDR
jgi:hypothetical protein